MMSGGKAVVESLKIEGVRCVFGLIGSATMEIFDALYKNKNIRFIGVRDERTGTHMADGYARASGKVGIILAGQNGPGVTNLVTGIAQAHKAFSPVISIAGDISSDQAGKDSFQEIDQQKLFEPITKKTWTINKINEIPKIISDAFKLVLSRRNGPVHINFPRNILSKTYIFKKFKKHKQSKITRASRKEISKTIDLLTKSSRPVIIAGGGIKNTKGDKEVASLAKKLNIPIVTSAGHGDALSSTENLYAGQMGPRGNIVATNLVRKADVILALGTRLGFNSTFFSYENINKKASIIHVDIEPSSLGRYFPITIGICTDSKTFVKQLYDRLSKIKNLKKTNIWTKNFLEEKKIYLKKREEEANFINPIQPSALFKILRETLPSNSVITLDAGTLCLQATDQLNYSGPKSLFTPLDFGLVGFSFACGLGVKLANPNSKVISLMGDGGFGMTISELSTAVEYKINTITIVLNNKSWGAEKAYQRDYYDQRYIGSEIMSPPFHKIVELYGGIGFHVKKINILKNVIRKALKCSKPVVINVEVDPNAIYSFRKDSFKHREQ
tara:strand:- start:985 stop:2655 length:1671 start_codon:yes stop_codon:yes gene_type:complete